MGIDAVIYAIGDYTEQQLEQAERIMHEKLGNDEYFNNEYTKEIWTTWIDTDRDLAPSPLGTVELNNAERYFDEYGRGWWPKIKELIDAFTHALVVVSGTEPEIVYHSDSYYYDTIQELRDNGTVLTPERRTSIDQAWETELARRDEIRKLDAEAGL